MTQKIAHTDHQLVKTLGSTQELDRGAQDLRKRKGKIHMQKFISIKEFAKGRSAEEVLEEMTQADEARTAYAEADEEKAQQADKAYRHLHKELEVIMGADHRRHVLAVALRARTEGPRALNPENPVCITNIDAEGKLRTVSARLPPSHKFDWKDYDYTVLLSEGSKGVRADKVPELAAADGTPIPSEVDIEKLRELALGNALLLDWCEREGWRINWVEDNVADCIVRVANGKLQRIQKGFSSYGAPQTMTEPARTCKFDRDQDAAGKMENFPGGINEWISSGTYESRESLKPLAPVLKDGFVYVTTLDEAYCLKCAPTGLLYTGLDDDNGEEVVAVDPSERTCDKGCSLALLKRADRGDLHI